MTTRTARARGPRTVPAPAPAQSASRTVTAAAVRQARRGTGIVAGLCAGMTALVARAAAGAEFLALVDRHGARLAGSPPSRT